MGQERRGGWLNDGRGRLYDGHPGQQTRFCWPTGYAAMKYSPPPHPSIFRKKPPATTLGEVWGAQLAADDKTLPAGGGGSECDDN